MSDIIKSSLYDIETSTGEEFYEFQFRDNKLIGVVRKGEVVPVPINPNTSEWFEVTSSSEALKAYNLAVNEKDGISTVMEEASYEELTQYYTENKTNYDNEETNVADENDLNVATTAFAAYRYDSPEKRKTTGTDVYTYPFDIDPLQDHLKISKYKYNRTSIQQSRPSGEYKNIVIQKERKGTGNLRNTILDEEIKIDLTRPGDSVRGSKLEGSVLLPMPKVVDTNGAEWGDSELNVIALAAATVSGQGLGLSRDQVQQEFGLNDKLFAKLRQLRSNPDKTTDFGDIQDLFASAVASSAIIRSTGQTVTEDQLLARFQGTVLNPNAELLFAGPVLRDFNFDFLMVARSEREGDEIRKIIRWFKTGMAPQFNSAALLSTPNIFTLEYKRGQGDMDVLNTVNRFSKGGLALRTFAVDYAPNGYWSAYQDSQPVALKCSMNFAELRPIYQRDQEDTPENSVGY